MRKSIYIITLLLLLVGCSQPKEVTSVSAYKMYEEVNSNGVEIKWLLETWDGRTVVLKNDGTWTYIEKTIVE